MGKSFHPQATFYSGMPAFTEISTNNAPPTSGLRLRSGRVIPRSTDNESHASASLASDQDEDTIPAFPFLKLPAELRVQIYRYLLHAHGDIYISKLDADSPELSKGILRRRFPEKECTRNSRTYGKMTTYEVNAIGVHPAILSVNWQTYLEASRIIYSENRFNFCAINHFVRRVDNAPIIPFLEDRSEGSRPLIKQIEYCYVFTDFLRRLCDPPEFAHLAQVFEETCTYLSQSLQLKHVTLNFLDLSIKEIPSYNPYKAYLLTLDKQSWVQQLVPLVKNLDTFRVTEVTGRDDSLVRATQTYLESKMHKASKTVRQSRTVQDLANAPAASEK